MRYFDGSRDFLNIFYFLDGRREPGMDTEVLIFDNG